MTPEAKPPNLHPAIPETGINPALSFLKSHIQPVLGDKITNTWASQAETWTQRFAEQTFAETIEKVGQIPSQRVTTNKEAIPLLKFKLEHWMIGGTLDIAGNQAISFAADQILHTSDFSPDNPELISALQTMGGAQARMRWKNRKQTDSTPLEQLQYLQRSQRTFVSNRLHALKHNPKQFREWIATRQLTAVRKFNQHAPLTNVILGRDDSGFLKITQEKGPWTQPALVEDPLRPFYEPKGISVSFYRYNEKTGEKEFFVCWGKRDAYARTNQLTPAWQTSFTRIQEGNHPDQDNNPLLDSLKDAFEQTQAANGVEISYIALNDNRHKNSAIAVATIDWSSYSPKDQATIMKVIGNEKGETPIHAWIGESKIAELRRSGLMDKDGNLAPAVNGFLAISLGSRSPTEILSDAANRHLSQDLHHILEQYPKEYAQLLEAISQQKDILTSEKLNLSSVSPNLIVALVAAIANQQEKAQIIEEVFPHQPHRLT